MRSPALLLATLAVITIAGCSADRSPLPTKPRAELETLGRAPISPLTHDGPSTIEPGVAYPTFKIRAPKGVKFPKDATVTMSASFAGDVQYDAGTWYPYRHLQLGSAFSTHQGHECCGSRFVARVKPHEVQVWFNGFAGAGTMRVSVGSRTFEMPIAASFREEKIDGLHECLTVYPADGVVLPCGVEP